MNVTFPRFPPVVEVSRDAVRFYVDTDGTRVLCRISYEALTSRFGFGLPGPVNEVNAADVFTANRAAIEDEVREVLHRSRKPVTEVLLVSAGVEVPQ
jgi:hypothetical protein